MPFDIADLWDETRSLDIEYKGRTFTIEYAPERYDTRAIAALSRYTQQLEAMQRNPRAALPDPAPLVDALERCLVRWDVRARGEPLALTRDNIDSFHWEALATILGQIGADQGVPEKNGNGSSSSSNTTESSEKRRRGTG